MHGTVSAQSREPRHHEVYVVTTRGEQDTRRHNPRVRAGSRKHSGEATLLKCPHWFHHCRAFQNSCLRGQQARNPLQTKLSQHTKASLCPGTLTHCCVTHRVGSRQTPTGSAPCSALNWWHRHTKDQDNKLDGTSWHERSVLRSRNWKIQILWPTHRITKSAHVHSKFLETISVEVIAKHHCSVTHISISLLLQVLDLLVTIDFLDFLQSPALLATSPGWAELPERISSVGVTYSPSPASAKTRTDCHACPGVTSGMPGTAAQAVFTSAQAVPAVMPNKSIPTISDSVHSCHYNNLWVIFSFNTAHSSWWLKQPWPPLQHKLGNSGTITTI